jgi:hypothetical protein
MYGFMADWILEYLILILSLETESQGKEGKIASLR